MQSGSNRAIKISRIGIRLLRGFFDAVETSSFSIPGRYAMLVGTTYLCLWVPDLDLLMISMLHHRSIVTHSLLPCILVAFFARRLGAAVVAGSMIGISVHLTCDLLSPMTGYAQIWLPAPIKAPLGPLSYLWLFGNAVVGFAGASLVARKAFPRIYAFPIVAGLSALTGATYGLLNEGAVLSALTVLLVVAFSLLPEGYMQRRLK